MESTRTSKLSACLCCSTTPCHLQYVLPKSASDPSVCKCSSRVVLFLSCHALPCLCFAVRCAASNCHKPLLFSLVCLDATNNVLTMDIHGSLACWNQPCHLQYFLKKSASDARVLRVSCCSFRACAAFQLSPPLLLNPTSLFQDGNPWMTMSV